MALSLPGTCDRAAMCDWPSCDDVRLDDARRVDRAGLRHRASRDDRDAANLNSRCVDRGALRYGACGDDVSLSDRWTADGRALCDSTCRGDMRLRQARARCRGALIDRISGDGVGCAATTTRTHVEIDSTLHGSEKLPGVA